MTEEQQEAPPTVPELPSHGQKMDERRRTRDRIDQMLRAYWTHLIAQGGPLAEEILERALREARLRGTLSL
jgi:hypothetical protein